MQVKKAEAYGKRVKVSYAIIINNISRMLSLGINLLFAIIIARYFSIAEMSSWTILMKLLNFSIVFSSLYVIWTTRAISRGWNVSLITLRLAMLIGIIVSISNFVILMILKLTDVAIIILLIFCLVLLENYLHQGVNAIISGYKPEFIGVFQFLLVSFKVAMAYIFVVRLKLGLFGALSALALSTLFAILLMAIFVRKLFFESTFDKTIANKWIKLSWYPLLLSIATSSVYFDIIIIKVLTQDDYLVAYYGVITFLINFVMSLATSRSVISTKILAKRSLKFIDEAIWSVLLFLIPIVVTILVFSKTVIFIFGQKYLPVADILHLFVIGAGLRVVYVIYKDSLLAWERNDYDLYSTFRIVDTIFMDILLLEIFQIAFYFGGLGIGALLIEDRLRLLEYWGILFVARTAIGFPLLNIISHRKFKIKIINLSSCKIILKYLLVGLILYAYGSTMANINVDNKRVFEIIYILAFPVVKVMLLYFIILLIIDSRFRDRTIRILKMLSKYLASFRHIHN